ncbi:sugar ABC transporter permease [Paenibacillus doosanensis]|uniref:carbohydrate ABC transporter permease n=1 Tax=Paenibacillus doosanensis TaxID=1229154 RepID=UPI00217F2E93|nr:sugar ABC transporter permease [Paenibacillus doosanensis]MCS7460066.1 sugar ABC transporter permease [Paenibacillus doosanensis]
MRRWREQLPGIGFTLPSLLLTLVFGVYPIFWAMRYMFYDYKGYGQERFVGLSNFTQLFHDQTYWDSVVNTFIYAGGKLILTLPLSLILAVILNRGLRGKHLLRAIYFMPTIVSTSVISIVFFIIFNSFNGILNQFLLRFHIIDKAIDWLGPEHAMLSVIIIAVWGAVGNYMLLFIAGLQNIPNDVYESASLDGANAVHKFWYITIPMLGPVLQMVVMLAIINSLKGYESIMVLTEGGPIGKTEVMFLYVYKQFFPIATSGSSVEQQIGYGSAVGFVTALIVGVVTLLYFYASKRMNKVYE